MRVTEQLLREAGRKRQKRAAEVWEEEEETMTYRTRKAQSPINAGPGIFQNSTMEGINTRESVFDRSAVFRT